MNQLDLTAKPMHPVFLGDGREAVDPVPAACLPGTYPLRVKRATARGLVLRFLQSGRSHHSGNAGTLWPVLLWCQTQRVAYTLSARPGEGYEIVKEAA